MSPEKPDDPWSYGFGPDDAAAGSNPGLGRRRPPTDPRPTPGPGQPDFQDPGDRAWDRGWAPDPHEGLGWDDPSWAEDGVGGIAGRPRPDVGSNDRPVGPGRPPQAPRPDGPDRPGTGWVQPGGDYDEVEDDDLADELERATRAEEARRNVIEWTVVLVGAVLLALALRAVVLQAFWIPSPSMEETLLIRDRVLVNKLSYRFGDIERGEIVVFHRTPEEIALDPNQPREVIKRVIAFGGETIEIRDNVVYIDSEAIEEPYLVPGVLTTDHPAELVPDGHLFVMGDNREISLDSRSALGPVAEDRVVGRAFVLFWPLNRIAWL